METRNSRMDPLWDPFVEFERLEEEFDRVFGLNRGLSGPGLLDRSITPALDLQERPEEFVVSAELPGLDLKDLNVTVTSNILTLSGTKREAQIPDKARLHRNELWEGEFRRTVSLPSPVNADSVTATLTDGILTVVLPKPEEAKPKRISITAR